MQIVRREMRIEERPRLFTVGVFRLSHRVETKCITLMEREERRAFPKMREEPRKSYWWRCVCVRARKREKERSVDAKADKEKRRGSVREYSEEQSV